MTRVIQWAILAVLLLGTAPAYPGPVGGHYREARTRNQRGTKIEPNLPYKFKDTFFANERACIIVEGDHRPVMNLTVKVFDSNKKLVTEDTGGDILAVTWYPPRTEQYTIVVSHDHPTEFNEVDIVVK